MQCAICSDSQVALQDEKLKQVFSFETFGGGQSSQGASHLRYDTLR